jgi:hypothetical protein
MKGISRIICLAVVFAIVLFSFVSAEKVNIDIKPTRCPNTLIVSSSGRIPVVVLGSETFDVYDIVPTSVRLCGVSFLTGGLEDVIGPVVPTGDPCACKADSADGFVDVDLRFSTQELVAALEMQLGRELVDKEVLVLNLTAVTRDGVALEGSDCVIVAASAGLYHNIPNIDK